MLRVIVWRGVSSDLDVCWRGQFYSNPRRQLRALLWRVRAGALIRCWLDP